MTAGPLQTPDELLADVQPAALRQARLDKNANTEILERWKAWWVVTVLLGKFPKGSAQVGEAQRIVAQATGESKARVEKRARIGRAFATFEGGVETVPPSKAIVAVESKQDITAELVSRLKETSMSLRQQAREFGIVPESWLPTNQRAAVDPVLVVKTLEADPVLLQNFVVALRTASTATQNTLSAPARNRQIGPLPRHHQQTPAPPEVCNDDQDTRFVRAMRAINDNTLALKATLTDVLDLRLNDEDREFALSLMTRLIDWAELLSHGIDAGEFDQKLLDQLEENEDSGLNGLPAGWIALDWSRRNDAEYLLNVLVIGDGTEGGPVMRDTDAALRLGEMLKQHGGRKEPPTPGESR